MAKNFDWQNLDARRQRLGMSCAVLARRAGVSLRSVQRILAGREANPGLVTITSIARELGLLIRLDKAESVGAMRKRQARRKAARMVAMVQATSALEGQAITSKSTKELRQRTVHELLGGSDRRLWAS